MFICNYMENTGLSTDQIRSDFDQFSTALSTNENSVRPDLVSKFQHVAVLSRSGRPNRLRGPDQNSNPTRPKRNTSQMLGFTCKTPWFSNTSTGYRRVDVFFYFLNTAYASRQYRTGLEGEDATRIRAIKAKSKRRKGSR